MSRWALILVLECLLAALPLTGQSLADPGWQYEVLLKLVSQNRRFQYSRIDSLHIAVYASPADSALQRSVKWRLQALPTPSIIHIISEPADDIRWQDYHAVVVLSAIPSRLAGLLPRWDEQQLFTLALEQRWLEQGIAAAVTADSLFHPQIWLNPPAMQRAAVSLGTDIFQLATIRKSTGDSP